MVKSARAGKIEAVSVCRKGTSRPARPSKRKKQGDNRMIRKTGIAFLIFALCFGTIFSFAYQGLKKDRTDGGSLRQAQDFEEIKAALKKTGMFSRGSYRNAGGMKLYGAGFSQAAEMETAPGDTAAVADQATSQEANSGSDFSSTNVQVDGIDEDDIVKTDGKYLYIASDSHIFIVSAKKEKMELVSTIDFQEKQNERAADTRKYRAASDSESYENSWIQSLFLDGDRLIVLGGRSIHETPAGTENGKFALPDVDAAFGVCGVYPGYDKSFTFVNIYDIQNRETPELLQEFSVSGSFRTARKADGLIYLVSNESIFGIMDLAKAKEDEILPLYSDTNRAEKDKQTVRLGERTFRPEDPTDVYLCPIEDRAAFTTLSILDVSGKKEARVQSYLGPIDTFYMNDESAFLTSEEYRYDEKSGHGESHTNIIALDVKKGDVRYRSEGRVPGSLLNQFSMDEYDGYFRIATTEQENGSNIFVLDKNLRTVGSIRNIAEGENIYGVRFTGSRGYIVTFETMDPFFTVDLSDPENPFIAGELKLPGYSNYLHPIDENTVLGIGRQTKELLTRDENGEEEVVGYREGGIKLSLFDIRDFSDPKELDHYVLGSERLWSDALFDHKAILTDSARGRIGICASSYSDAEKAVSGAYLFEIQDGHIRQQALWEKEQGNGVAAFAFDFDRLCYIGDTYYYLQDGVIRAFEQGSASEMGRIELGL